MGTWSSWNLNSGIVYIWGEGEEEIWCLVAVKHSLREPQILILVKHSLTYWLTLTPTLEIIMANPTGTGIAKNQLPLDQKAGWHLSHTHLWLTLFFNEQEATFKIFFEAHSLCNPKCLGKRNSLEACHGWNSTLSLLLTSS